MIALRFCKETFLDWPLFWQNKRFFFGKSLLHTGETAWSFSICVIVLVFHSVGSKEL